MNTTPTPDQTPESSPGFKAAKALREAGYLSSHYSNTHQLFTEAGKIIEASFVESSEELTNLRATNAKLAERVRRLEEALTKMVTGFYGHHLCENDGRRCMACELAEETLKQLPPTPGAAVEKEGE